MVVLRCELGTQSVRILAAGCPVVFWVVRLSEMELFEICDKIRNVAFAWLAPGEDLMKRMSHSYS